MPPRTRNSPFGASGSGRKTKKARTSKEAPPPPPVDVKNTDSDSSPPPPRQDNEGDTEPIQPKKFFFPHTEYCKPIKIASKCENSNTIKALDILERDEKKWFTNHPQFKHIWHMPTQKNHKLMGMWLTLLRTVVMEKNSKMCWFVVNGVPVRYSLREHGLISGLDCRKYPRNYEKLGSTRFIKRVFGRVEGITVVDVREQLKYMIGDGDRLKMALLLFLSTVIGSQQSYGVIDPFFLTIVDDLHACENFPWGRYTFDQNMREIFHMMEHFKGKVKPGYTWCFPGFIIPLELLATECIPRLRKKFLEDVLTANSGCPRMCKRKWRAGYMKGFPLEEVNDALGDDKVSKINFCISLVSLVILVILVIILVN